jgi:hypothetical protein
MLGLAGVFAKRSAILHAKSKVGGFVAEFLIG